MNFRGGLLARWVIPIVGGALAIAALFWLYGDLDLGRFVGALADSEPGWLITLGAAILAEQLLRGWKWRQILYDLKPISSWRLFGAIVAGYGAAIIIPLGINPLVRSWLIARLEGLRMAAVLVTAAIERFIDGIVFALVVGIVALAGRIPSIEGDLRLGLGAAGALSLVLFVALLRLLFKAREPLLRADSRTGRMIDWLASKAGARFADLRSSLAEGIIWPRTRARRFGVVVASLGMKAIAATHFLWAGLAVGITLGVFDYLFLLVFAGFALVLARFIRVPGGFVIGSGYALKLLGVADEHALAMILFSHMISIGLMVGIGVVVLWRSGIGVHQIRAKTDEPA